jgi:NADPH2 dehydrogenase
MSERFPRVASLRDAAALRERLAALGLDLPCDDEVLRTGSRVLANRFVIQPMEGWDGELDGRPGELTVRRWQGFGRSGAAWMWGGEAVAVRADGRANPRQLVLTEATAASLGGLRRELLRAAREAGGVEGRSPSRSRNAGTNDVAGAPSDEPLVGLQLTHSGRWCRPTEAGRAPRVAFRHPLLDARAGVVSDEAVLDDREVDELVRCFARAARLAREESFDFVDVKHCHGYLLHEFLAARSRPGAFGGASLEARTRLALATIAAVRDAAPELAIGIRLSIFDALPHRPETVDEVGRLGRGVPEDCEGSYDHAFGLDPEQPERIDLSEPIAFVRRLRAAGVEWINVTAGSPYYVPHVQRPAAFPPSDGYAPPEDPLAGVVRLLRAARDLKAAVPEIVVVSSGWSYLQEYVPHVAQACLRAGWFDAVGLGRMVLSYPELPRDALAGRPLDRRRLCRTFSDCTTAPRHGLVSGCYPLDPFYRARPERAEVERIKHRAG